MVRLEGGADLGDVGAVSADGVVELFAGDAELVGPVGNVGGQLGVDLVGVVRALVVLLVRGMGLAGLGLFDFFVLVGTGGIGVGPACFPLSYFS